MDVIKLYKSFVDLEHKKEQIYSIDVPTNCDYDEVSVEIPLPVWRNQSNELCITIGKESYLICDILTSWGGKPAFSWVDGKSPRGGNSRRHLILKEI